MRYSAKEEERLMARLWSPDIKDDLEAFVRFTWPWGQKGTPLAGFSGPRVWQLEDLREISEYIQKAKEAIDIGVLVEMFTKATCSGRGPGKSAEVAWLIWWMMSTRIGSTTIVTANTEPQLKTKTWAELGKWATMAINSHWFERSALSLKPTAWFEDAVKRDLKIDPGYYYAQATLWNADNPDAFAGAHNPLGEMVIFDEASGIPKQIWTVTEGFFTEPMIDRYWMVFSNGRRNTGPFFDCFHADRKFWRTRQLDSRTVEGVDQQLYQRMIDKHGIDSDEVRVEVRGMFPQTGDKQFISRELIDGAAARELERDNHAPLILGVDIARFGTAKTVLRWRQGRDARSIPPVEIKGRDNMQVAYEIAHWIDKTNPDAVCIDAGNGTGVIDRLRELHYKVHEVWFGSKSSEQAWDNKRTELYAELRDWLEGGIIDDHQELKADLAAPEYLYVGVDGSVIRLEPKEQMVKRGLPSPDHSDALVCTFAVKPARRDMRAGVGNRRQAKVAADVDYALFG